ncbi:FAD-binding oxidoreductase [Aureimonas sp. AU12]|uniref:FAD-binding oxidoreductase n=1 Tax=Aureimonas sp. AU12 TaxID=1638161 RepID=UPI00078245FA
MTEAERDALTSQMTQALGADAVLTEPDDIARYCRDWHGDVTTGAVAVLRPNSTGAVSEAVRLCARLGLAIVPQGGNTGLVLGGIPDDAGRQVVLSLERMTAIRRIDADDFSAVVDAGCVLEVIKQAVEAEDRFFPLSLGAQGSCRIGGNVSTNAGGINVLRYGMTRELILGLEVVLPDGTIWDGLSTLRKDNRGIDLKQIFIGAEGTLGIVTGVALKLLVKPTQVETALLALAGVEEAMALYRRARRDCCDLMSAFELLGPEAIGLAQIAHPDLPNPMEGSHPAYVLMEMAGTGLIDIRALLDRFLEGALEEGLVLDGVVAASRAQAAQLWRIREGMNDGQAMLGPHLRTDVSVPLSRVAAFVGAARDAVARELPDCRSVAYGHVGDGNIHFNVLPPQGADAATAAARIKAAKALVNGVLDGFDGSISAEHGIGRLKREDFEARLKPVQEGLLRALKSAIDPDGRMNPGCQLTPP